MYFKAPKMAAILEMTSQKKRGPIYFFLFCPKCLVEASRIPKIPFIDLGKDSSINCISNPVCLVSIWHTWDLMLAYTTAIQFELKTLKCNSFQFLIFDLIYTNKYVVRGLPGMNPPPLWDFMPLCFSYIGQSWALGKNSLRNSMSTRTYSGHFTTFWLEKLHIFTFLQQLS